MIHHRLLIELLNMSLGNAVQKDTPKRHLKDQSYKTLFLYSYHILLRRTNHKKMCYRMKLNI